MIIHEDIVMKKNSSPKDYREEKELSFSELTDRILFAIDEGNVVKAKALANIQVEQGMPGYLEDLLTEWKFYLVRVITLIVEQGIRSGTVTEYLEQKSADGLRDITARAADLRGHALRLQTDRS